MSEPTDIRQAVEKARADHLEGPRAKVRELIQDFALGFSAKGAHAQKLDRYVDVLEDCDLDHLRAGLDELKADSSLPSPAKIREAMTLAVKQATMLEEKRKEQERLSKLADPGFRARARDEQARRAGDLRLADDLLEMLVQDAARLGLVGEPRALKLLYLVLQTRHFAISEQRPVSAVVKGSSSSGKSHTAKTAIRFVPSSAVIEMTGMSPKWMVYASQQGLSFKNRFLFVHEASGIDEEVEAMLRVLLSENAIIWRTVIDQVAHDLIVEGPTGLIETTTRISIHPENETRVISIPVDESAEQTRKVLERLGKEDENAVDLDRWHALDRWIALGAKSVRVPFQKYIGQLAKPAAPRVRRDMTTLLGLVRAHALLHEDSREHDDDGRVVAHLDDYEAVHDLTEDLFAEASETSVSLATRQVVDVVVEIVGEKMARSAHEASAATAEIAARLGRNRRTVNRWIQQAVAEEYLDEVSPDRRETSPRRVRVGARPLPAVGDSIFPTAQQIESAMAGDGADDGVGFQELDAPRDAGTADERLF